MREREQSHSWPLEGLKEAFKTSPERTRDIAFGDGLRFVVDQEKGKTLELYPQAGVARVSTRDARIELHRVDPPLVSSEGIMFDGQREGEAVRLSVTPRGEIALLIAPLTGEVDNVPEETPGPEKPPEQAESRERERLMLAGRVGATPAYRTTPKGLLVARFPLAVHHHEEQKTSWHTVLAFGERAKKLQDNLKKGDAIEVIGYLHTRQMRTREGKNRMVQEIYAVVVKTR
ncbi:MAG: single-stranded DNA-binding protein [Chloroflexota bacterium]|nr:MAG: single-stranded DNA-binding protein [Chloroflexota bacterium]